MSEFSTSITDSSWTSNYGKFCSCYNVSQSNLTSIASKNGTFKFYSIMDCKPGKPIRMVVILSSVLASTH
jgi:hypothetical protein